MNNHPSRTDRYCNRALIRGEGLEDIAITGRGTIDGQGALFRDNVASDGEMAQFKADYEAAGRYVPNAVFINRPYIIQFVSCRNILIENVRHAQLAHVDAALSQLRLPDRPRHQRVQPRLPARQRHDRHRRMPQRDRGGLCRRHRRRRPHAEEQRPHGNGARDDHQLHSSDPTATPSKPARNPTAVSATSPSAIVSSRPPPSPRASPGAPRAWRGSLWRLWMAVRWKV